MMLAPPEEPPTRNVVPFNPRRLRGAPPQGAVWSGWARHVIICVEDAFPAGTVRRLRAAAAQDCFAVIDTALDACEGSPYLRVCPVWNYLESEFGSVAHDDYQVITHHVGSTHAHVLMREAEGFCLDATVERWKTLSVLGATNPRVRDGRLWAPGYYDTVLAGPREIEAARMAIDLHRAGPPGGRNGG